MAPNQTDTTTWMPNHWLNLSTTMDDYATLMENVTMWKTMQQSLTLLRSNNETRNSAQGGLISALDMISLLDMTTSCRIYQVFMSVGIAGPLIVFGLVGNVLSSIVLLRQRRAVLNASMNFLLVVLSFLDSFMLLSLFWLKTVPSLCELGYWPEYLQFYYSYLLTYLWPLTSTILAVNEYTVVLIAFQRYLHVCHNKIAKKYCTFRRTKVQTLMIFVLGFAYSIPRFLEYKLVYNPRAHRKVRTKTALMKSHTYKLWYHGVSFYIVIYVIPLILLATLTYKLVRAVREARQKRAELVSSEAATNSRKSDEDVTVSLVAVVCVFCFTQIHNPIRRTLEFFVVSQKELGCPHSMFYYIEINTLLNVVNYSVNFLMYFMFNKRFRGQLRQLLCQRNEVVPLATLGATSGTDNLTEGNKTTKTSRLTVPSASKNVSRKIANFHVES